MPARLGSCRRKFTAQWEASRRGPETVAAAKPQAVSMSALTTPACKKPEYWPTSLRHGIASYTLPVSQDKTSKPHQRLNSAESLMLRMSAVALLFTINLRANLMNECRAGMGDWLSVAGHPASRRRFVSTVRPSLRFCLDQ